MRSVSRIRTVMCLGLGVVLSLGVATATEDSSTTSKTSQKATRAHSKAVSGTATKSTTASKSGTKSTAKAGTRKSSVHRAVSSSSKTSRGKSSKKGSKNAKGRKRGQQAIDSDRAREIQEALIREHYLQGEPSGKWDASTQAAMQKFQADQGWQSKTTPDSRALIKLGLGPSKEHLLNPESAMTSADSKAAAKATPSTPAADPPVDKPRR